MNILAGFLLTNVLFRNIITLVVARKDSNFGEI